MGRIFRAWFFLLSISVALSAEPRWIHVPSTDFEIYSSAGEGDTRRVLQYFERVRSFFAQSLTGGVTDEVFPVAVHEYVHLVVQHADLNLPPWLNEGLAELYSTLKPAGDKILATPASASPPAEMSQTSALTSTEAAELPSIQGAFTELDCSGASPRVVLQTSEGRVFLPMDDPGRVRISGLATNTVDLHCGPQKTAAVSAQYEPAGASQGSVKGRVRAIRFEPEPGKPGKK